MPCVVALTEMAAQSIVMAINDVREEEEERSLEMSSVRVTALVTEHQGVAGHDWNKQMLVIFLEK